MARPLRIQFAGATYHITNRGNERRPIFFGDEDRRAFLEYLAATVQRFGWSVTAWVLMTNHFHLVVQTPEANLSQGMQWLEWGGTWGHTFEVRHRGHWTWGRTWGHTFEIRHGSSPLRRVAGNARDFPIREDPALPRTRASRV